MIEKRKVRVVFTRKVYYDKPYVIPIIKTNAGWQTGQELSEEKMTNPDLLTKEDKEKYPFVIDPTNHYKVGHLTWLHCDTPYGKAICDLLVLCGDWAIGKHAYEDNKGRYIGYLEDKQIEAQQKNKKRDERYEAEKMVREMPAENYRRVSMMLNTLLPSFNLNVDSVSLDEIKEATLNACEESSEIVKMCFEKHNPGIAFEYFIVECLHYGVLNKKVSGDIFDGNEFIGSSVNDVRKYIEKKDNEYRREKWNKSLNARKGIIVSDVSDNTSQEVQMVQTVKLAFFDNDNDAAKTALDVLTAYYPNNSNVEGFRARISSSVSKEPGKPVDKSKEIEKFRNEQLQRTLDEIHATVEHHKTDYQKDDVVGIWDDKEALIEYMVKVRFKLT